MSLVYGADSVTPSRIPESYEVYKNRGALLYGNGDFRASAPVVAEFPRHLFISTLGDADTAVACDMLDVERFDATATDWPGWRERRVAWCKENNSTRWPKVYCSIDPDATHGVKAIIDATKAAKQEPVQHWGLAYYTPRPYTQAELAHVIKELTGETVDPTTIYGQQWRNAGTYDEWVIFQDPGWA